MEFEVYQATYIAIAEGIIRWLNRDENAAVLALFERNRPCDIFKQNIHRELYRMMDMESWLTSGGQQIFNPDTLMCLWGDAMYEVTTRVCMPN